MQKELLFNEIYSVYYHMMTKLIRLASIGKLDDTVLFEVLSENNELTSDLIGEKIMFDWSMFINTKYETAFGYPETRPVTNLELRWLKSIINDPRIQLFDFDFCKFEKKLEKVEPLFTEKVFSRIGQYKDGDDFKNTKYIEHFRTILKSIKKEKMLEIKFVSIKNDNTIIVTVKPIKLEYSEREDKFRLIANSEFGRIEISLNTIEECKVVDCSDKNIKCSKSNTELVAIELVDEQNSLERFLTDISHYYKKVKRIDGVNKYRIEINYDKQEEMELVALHLLPFLNFIEIKSPDTILKIVSDRIEKQKKLFKY